MTTLNRLGSVTLLNDTMRDVGNLQKELATLQEQISSGVKAKTFQQLNGQVEQYTLLESRIRRTQQFMESNEVAIARMQTADQAMSQLIDIADSMENLLVAGLDAATGTALPLEQQMKDLLNAMASALNTNFDGRYIFAGTATNVIPVPSTDVDPAQQGVPDAGYYAGSTTSIKLRADETVEYDFPVRADDPAFQKMYAAAKQALAGHASGDREEMKAALTLMQQAQTDLNSSRARVNMTFLNVGDINERLGSLNLYWKGVTEKVGKTDIVAATTQIASYEAVLQATFQVYARLSQLRLSDYLR